MIKLLVVSDNADMSIFLREELNRQKLDEIAQMDLCCSPSSSSQQAMIDIGANEINLKDEKTIEEVIENYDLVFSLHCKQIFPSKLVNNKRCINFHPGYNPYNRGWFPHVFSIINKLPAGATIHVMDEEIDHGAIISQRQVDITFNETSLEVYKKVLEQEKELIQENLSKIIMHVYETTLPEIKGNYNSIKDYNKLCLLDLNRRDTLENHINLLRAVSHDSKDNAYAIINGKKYYVNIIIKESK